MSQERVPKEDKVLKSTQEEQSQQPAADPRPATDGMAGLQQSIGNRAVQRLLAQRGGGDSAFELDDVTAGRINQARGGGQALDAGIQKQMGAATGHDFSGVRVHTGSESDELNQQLSARAFTTGQDIFFRDGAYEPESDSGRELIAHELTHVTQQSSGAVGGGNKMKVNPPGDVYEQEADAIAGQVAHTGTEASAEAASGGVAQRQAPEEEEVQTKALQRQAPEEEEVQTKALQRQAPEEEEEVQAKAVQRQAPEEEEEVQTKALQRQEEEEPEEEV